MRVADLYARIEALPKAIPGEVRPPPPEIVAFFVGTTRRFRKWKKSALADLAGVSLSTVERVERGESVVTASLEKIEAAFGVAPGYISKPRAPLTHEELIADLERKANVAYVEVQPLTKHAQVRTLADCCGIIPLSNVERLECHDDFCGLLEWLDLASFMRSDHIEQPAGQKSRLRELYDSILKRVKAIERQGFGVLVGTLDHPVEGIADWRYAVVYVASKKSDPGAATRQYIPVDTTTLPKKVSLADCAQWMGDD